MPAWHKRYSCANKQGYLTSYAVSSFLPSAGPRLRSGTAVLFLLVFGFSVLCAEKPNTGDMKYDAAVGRIRAKRRQLRNSCHGAGIQRPATFDHGLGSQLAYSHIVDFIGNRELEGPGTLWVSLKIFLVGCWWTAPKGHPAATSTPPKGDSRGPAAPKPPCLLLPIKSNEALDFLCYNSRAG